MTRISLAFALGAFGLIPIIAGAQTGDMACDDDLAADRAAMQSDPEAAAIDGKMRAYCKLHPKASTSEAASVAMK